MSVLLKVRTPLLPSTKAGIDGEDMHALLEENMSVTRPRGETPLLPRREGSGAWRPYYVGESINRYYIARRLWIDTSKDGINYKDEDFYRGKRLLVRKTGIGIMATIDESSTSHKPGPLHVEVCGRTTF